MKKYEDIKIGDRFGRLVVTEYFGKKGRDRFWRCQCDCGKEAIVRDYCLKSGNNRSCGCLRNELNKERFVKHGLSKTKLYRVWRGIKERCNNENNKSFYLYGGKGINLCDEWYDFQNFYDWSLDNGYAEGLTIDRIDSNLDYTPENCRWADRYVQNNNTSRNHMITFRGETKTMAQWAKALNMSYYAIKSRLNKYHWSVEKALTTPVK